MNGFERQRLIVAVVLLVTALFVGGNLAGARWRRPLRVATVIGFAIAVGFALAEIGLWLAGSRSG